MLKFIFHSTSLPPKGGNRVGYNNQEFDKVIDLATVETIAKKRTSLYKKAIEISNKDYAYINLWHPNIVWVGSRCLENIELDPFGGFYPLLKIKKNKEGDCGH
jgi:peptide/nickel transport system substrate-binding protein